MPGVAILIIENQPQPDPEWISEARERLALILVLEGFIECFVTVTGDHRGVMFPVLIKSQLGRAPVFLTADSDSAPTRRLEKVRISFNKSC